MHNFAQKTSLKIDHSFKSKQRVSVQFFKIPYPPQSYVEITLQQQSIALFTAEISPINN